MSRLARFVCLVWMFFTVLSLASHAQNYLTATGAPTYSAPEPVEYGFVETANGNLHLEIPLGSFPQRGGTEPYVLRLVYDSHIWQVEGTQWTTRFSGNILIGAGWRYIDNVWGRISTTPYSWQGCGVDVAWTDSSGTARYFALPTVYNSSGAGNCSSSANAFATDSSGYRLYKANNRFKIYAPDGIIVYDGGYDGPGWTTDAQGNKIVAIDSNGNYLSVGNQGPVDTLGRVPSLKDNLSLVYDLANSQSSAGPTNDGLRSRYTITHERVRLKTDFRQAGITEANGDVYLVQSITLPDGTSYSFKYDCDSSQNSNLCTSGPGRSAYYGVLTRLTLPTGGTISYDYTTFIDAFDKKSVWLASKSSAGGMWRYTPQVISRCSSPGPNCRQQLTSTKPNGDSTVYAFTLDNGAWPTQVDSYESGTLLSSVKNTWDFSQSCPLKDCQGHSYIRKTAETTTLYAPSTALTKKVQYTYLSPQTGLILKTQEWKFLPGASPTFPAIADRTTNISYYTGGPNNINRPARVTLCNNSGSDPDCSGGGGKVSQTITTYDNYAAICGLGSGLVDVSGVANHDDAAFGSTYYLRGNPTEVRRWISGSTYASTAYAYDTTGQVIRVRDANQNCTAYEYDDQFYTDNGANPPLSVPPPSLPTNAHLTRVTYPAVNGIALEESYGYYIGSSKTARATDANSQSTFYHFEDPLDRATSTRKPIGWNLVEYTSPTVVSTYVPVDEDEPSTTCTSCRHQRLTYDTWGREIARQLVNNPDPDGLAVSTETTYDLNGRISAVSHPFKDSSTRVWERFAYDGFDRSIAATHPDGQSSRTAYGTRVGHLGGVTTQQSSTSTYGYGYPTVEMDEAGRQVQKWVDGFGNVIEVDEPSGGTGTHATRTITVQLSGSLQRSYNPCSQAPGIPECPYTVYNRGAVTLTVNGFAVSVSYYPGVTAQDVAAYLAGGLNTPSSPVLATRTGSTTIVLTSIAPGATTNFAFSSGGTYSSEMCGNEPCFSGPAFSISPAAGSLSGGTGGLPSSPFVTSYTYDIVGRLTQVVQGLQTRTFSYDGLGRVTSMQGPEVANGAAARAAGQQPTRCAVTSTYDGNGNVISRTSPAPNQVGCATTITACFSYDALNRPISKGYGGSSCATPSTDVTYSYDQSQDGGTFTLGRRTAMTDPTGSETYSYDGEGRIRRVRKTIGGATYTSSYEPGVAGQLKQMTYPSGRQVIQQYDNIGRLQNVSSGGVNYASGFAYDAEEHVTTFRYGNGVTAEYGYSNDRSQLMSLSYSNASQTLLRLNYGYKNGQANCGTGTTTGNDGLVQCIQDTTGTPEAGRSVVYAYDSLARLTAATTTGSTAYPQWGLAWSYDRYGNRLTQTIMAGSGYSSSLTFGTLPAGVGAYTNQPDDFTYDSAGNLINGNGQFYYDNENRMISANSGAGVYTYDGNGIRVTRSAAGTNTVYVWSGTTDIAEYENGADPASPSREYIYAGSTLVATLSAANTVYHHADHLSVRVNTNQNGAKVGEQGHYPYGEQWYVANTIARFLFTTYQRDNETGLNYAIARYYSSQTGRFCSVDPVGGNPLDPQSWNRYVYVRDNPVQLVDPDGRTWLGTLFSILAAVGSIFTGNPAPLAMLGQSADQIGTETAFNAVPMLAGTGMTMDRMSDLPAKQNSASKPVYCYPSIMDAINAAWTEQIAPNTRTGGKPSNEYVEAGFPAYRTPQGGYQAGNGPGNKPPEIQTGPSTGFQIDARPNADSYFHTHRLGLSGLPSTPDNHSGEGLSGDTGLAASLGKDVYVISYEGLSKASGLGPRNPKWTKENEPWIIRGKNPGDWLKKLRKKCQSM